MADYDQSQGDPLAPLPQSMNDPSQGSEGGERQESSEGGNEYVGPFSKALGATGDTLEQLGHALHEPEMRGGGAGLSILGGGLEMYEGVEKIHEGERNPDQDVGAVQQVEGGLLGAAGYMEVLGGGATVLGIGGAAAELGPLGMAFGVGLGGGTLAAHAAFDPEQGKTYTEARDDPEERLAQEAADLQQARNLGCNSSWNGTSTADEQCRREKEEFENGAQSIK